jgi:hypothetical protein
MPMATHCVGVAIHFAPEFVELPRLEARTLNAEEVIEIGVAERASQQSIQSATSQTLVASLRLLVRRQVHCRRRERACRSCRRLEFRLPKADGLALDPNAVRSRQKLQQQLRQNCTQNNTMRCASPGAMLAKQSDTCSSGKRRTSARCLGACRASRRVTAHCDRCPWFSQQSQEESQGNNPLISVKNVIARSISRTGTCSFRSPRRASG